MRWGLLWLMVGGVPACGLFDSTPDGNDDTEPSGTDTDGTPVDGTDVEGTDADDIVPSTCRDIDLIADELPNLFPDSGGYSGDLQQGGDGLLLIVNDGQLGTFDLACPESNPLFCDRAALLLHDNNSYIGFRGQFEIIDAMGDSSISMRLVDAEFRILDDALQPVSDGDCVAANEPMVLSTETVVRLPSDCTQLQVDAHSARLDGLLPGFFSADVTDPTGDITGDLFLEFFSSQTGTYDLQSNSNDNYSRCEQCVSVSGDNGLRAFQSRGVVRVDSDPSGTTLDVVLSNVELTEVTLGDGSVSTPVPNGRCWSLPNPLALEVD